MNPKIHQTLRILETAEEIQAVEELQRQVWPGSEIDIIPLHVLVTAAHNGGLVIGAFDERSDSTRQGEGTPPGESATSLLVGFVFGFPGLYFTPDGPRPKHCSHELGVLREYRDLGIGFTLKRAQWQMVRAQGLDLITWTYDPLQSRNARLNISKLGAVCNAYLREVYGTMRDGLNQGLPSDRFQVDWWVNSPRVNRRLSRRARRPLDLAHYLAAGAMIVNPCQESPSGWPRPVAPHLPISSDSLILLVEIPSDIQALKQADPALALEWRMSTRELFEELFSLGYLITDFVFLPGAHPRSYYVLSHGDGTL